MKKLKKNKFIFLVICVIVVSFVYIVFQKAINKYSFEYNEVIEIIDGEDNGRRQ